MAMIFVAVAWLPCNHCFTHFDSFLLFKLLISTPFTTFFRFGSIYHFHNWINYNISNNYIVYYFSYLFQSSQRTIYTKTLLSIIWLLNISIWTYSCNL